MHTYSKVSDASGLFDGVNKCGTSSKSLMAVIANTVYVRC